MTWGAVASVGGSLISGMAAGDTSDAQQQGADRARAQTQAQYKTTRNDLGGYRSSGNAANNKLSMLLGTPVSDYERYMQSVRERFPDISENWTPYEGAVEDFAKANPQDTSSSDFGSLLKKYTGADLASEPGFQFRQAEGQKGVERSAAGRGGLFSGAAGKALTRYNQDYASNEYQNAFNRDASQKQQTYGMLSGQSAQGLNAATQTGNFGANAAAQGANYTTQGANAQAAGMVGQANSLNGGIQNYQNYNLLNSIYNQKQNSGGSSEPYPGYNASIGMR